jgi:hypothetical protein
VKLTETERKLRSGRYKGVAVPSSLQPVDDPAHADGLRWFRAGVDAALDTVQTGVDRAVDAIRREAALNPAAAAPLLVEPVPVRVCHLLGDHGSHYWAQGVSAQETRYCPGNPW